MILNIGRLIDVNFDKNVCLNSRKCFKKRKCRWVDSNTDNQHNICSATKVDFHKLCM